MNPLPNWFIQQFGAIGILYLKVPLLIALGYAIYFRWGDISEGFRKVVEPLMYITVGVYCVVILWSAWLYLSTGT